MASETTPLVVVSPNSDAAITSSLQRARRLLYASHFSSQFSQQTWEFGLTLFLAAFTDYKSLLLVSTYGIVTGAAICIAGPSAGRYFVDGSNWNRISAAKFLIWTQNASVLITSAMCYALLLSKNQQHHSKSQNVPLTWIQNKFLEIPIDFYSVMLIVGIHIFGPLAQILDKAFLVTIERDWVVVMGEQVQNLKQVGSSSINQPSRTWLSETNVFMKQIDLSCRVAAPSFAGLVIGASVAGRTENHADIGNEKLAFAAFLIGLLNGLSLIVEYCCTAHIYQLIPALAVKRAVVVPVKTQHSDDDRLEDSNDVGVTQSRNKTTSCCAIALPFGLEIYLAQPISWAGVSLALL
jgi:Ferroportin1 (FPN1)